jgi:hypothetical protein
MYDDRVAWVDPSDSCFFVLSSLRIYLSTRMQKLEAELLHRSLVLEEVIFGNMHPLNELSIVYSDSY